jgi:hypothetical protein
MSYETFSFLFQLISAIGVIVSFVYLAVQIRQNTRAMRRAASRDIVRDLNEFGRMFIEYPDLGKLYLTALEQPQDLTAEERFRFERLVGYVFASFELALEYHGDGLLSDEGIEAYTQSILQLFERSAVAEWWGKEGQYTFSQRFRDLVSERRAASAG